MNILFSIYNKIKIIKFHIYIVLFRCLKQYFTKGKSIFLTSDWLLLLNDYYGKDDTLFDDVIFILNI